MQLKDGQKILTDTSPKKIHREQISIEKDAPHHLSPGKCKLKLSQKWDSTTHLWEQLKSQTLIPNAGEDVEQQELSFIADANAKCYSRLGRQFGGFLQNKKHCYHRIPNHAPWFTPKRVENLCPRKNLHTNVSSSFILNCQNLEATKMSFSRWVDRQSVVHPDNRILFISKKEWAIKLWKDMEETYTDIVKWKKLTWRAPYCMSPSIWHLEKAKLLSYWGSKKISGCQGFLFFSFLFLVAVGWGGEGWTGGAQEIFRVVTW